MLLSFCILKNSLFYENEVYPYSTKEKEKEIKKQKFSEEMSKSHGMNKNEKTL